MIFITGPLYSGKRTFAKTLPGRCICDVKSGLHCVVPEARLGVRQQDFLEFQCMHMQEWEFL